MELHLAPIRRARGRVSLALGHAAGSFPQLDPLPLDTSGLEPRDARLALAIHRTVMQRWITLEYLLDGCLRQPMHAMEPCAPGVLLGAAAQIIFMDRLPPHAVVDESVDLARTLVRPGAAGLVNAVLRRLGQLRLHAAPSAENPEAGAVWEPVRDRLPTDEGFIRLAQPLLPHPGQLITHLSIATSHPIELIQQWVDRFGAAAAARIASYGIVTPPTIVAVEPGWAPGAGVENTGGERPWLGHAQAGFIVWTGGHDALVEFLAENPARRVQDPASALAMQATAGLGPKLIVDYCAGRGTKTRQLALLHPRAQILATDINPDRVASLGRALAGFANVRAVAMHELRAAMGQRRADLLVLDVPCSNTAVLARRPEARYRFSRSSLESLIALQRRIVVESAGFLAEEGAVLYSTCSLDAAEDQGQAAWIAKRLESRVSQESLHLPDGAGAAYHDGSYHALIRRGAKGRGDGTNGSGPF